MTVEIYITFTKYNMFFKILKNNTVVKISSMGHYKFKNRKKILYLSLLIVLNNILKNIIIGGYTKYVYVYLKGFNNYKINIIKIIYKYFLNKTDYLYLIDTTNLNFNNIKKK